MRIAVVAYNYHWENLQLQPWRYLHEIAKGLIALSCELVVITDGYPLLRKTSVIENVPMIRLPKVKHFPPTNFDSITRTIAEINPDVILWLMGLTNFFQKRLYERLGYNIVALVGSPVYSKKKLLTNLSLSDFLQNIDQLMTSFAETLTPRCLIRGTFNLDFIKAVVTMSERNKENLRNIGVKSDKLVSIPAGVDPFFLRLPPSKDVSKAREKVCDGENNCFLITFFGPPLTIRGIDTLLLAVKLAREKSLSSCIRLLILSREQRREHVASRRRLEKLATKLGLNKITRFEHGFLDRNEIKTYLAASDLLALPFKHVVSDVPVSILEGMCLGKPVLSTNLDGIPELLGDKRGFIINPADVRGLAQNIAYCCKNMEELEIYGEQARKYMLGFPSWEDSALKMHSLLRRFTE
jgi:glycosyltransferase involved in cell wall biosynthesis